MQNSTQKYEFSGAGTFNKTVGPKTDRIRKFYQVFIAASVSAAMSLCNSNVYAQVSFESTPVKTVAENQTYTYKISAKQAGGNPVTLTGLELPSWLTLSYNAGTAVGISDHPRATAVAMDDNGNTYVSSTSSPEIYKIAPDGTKTLFCAKENGISWGMRVHDGFLYVSVWRPGCAGQTLHRYPLSNPSAGQTLLNSTTTAATNGISIYNNHVYFANFECNKIGRVNLATLAVEDYITNVIPGAGPNKGPFGIAVNKHGEMYVTDREYAIYKFDAGSKTNPKVVSYPDLMLVSLDTDDQDNLYIGYAGNGVRKANRELTTTTKVLATGVAYALDVTPAGIIRFGDYSKDKVIEVQSGYTLTGQPSHEHVGDHPVKLKATAGGEDSEQDFIITVTDPNAPQINLLTPALGSTDINFDTTLVATFNEKVEKGTGKIYVRDYADDRLITEIDVTSNDVVVDGNKVSLRLTGLPMAKTVYIGIDNGAIRDLSRNNFPGVVDRSWYFSIVAKHKQTISFTADTSVVYGAEAYLPGASSDSKLEISYHSSDNNIAAIVDGKIEIRSVGTVTITASQDGNNEYLAAAPATQVLKITPKTITASFDQSLRAEKVYDGQTATTVDAAGFSLAGIVGTDEVKVSGEANFTDKNAGENKQVQIRKLVLSGANAANYELNTTALGARGNILKKEIAAKLLAQPAIEKMYDGTDNATITAANLDLKGVLVNEQITVSATANFDNKHAGHAKTVTATQFVIDGAEKNNYKLITTSSTATGDIKPQPISISAQAKTMVYGAAEPQLSYDVQGLVKGDAMKGSLKREAGKNVGSYAISLGSLSAGDDYEVKSFTPANLAITQAKLVITVDHKTRKQGEVNPEFSFSYQGLAGGDSPADLDVKPTATTSAVAGSPIGYYEILATPAVSPNYSITMVTGRLSVVPAGSEFVKVWTSSATVLQVRVFAETAQKSRIVIFTHAGQPMIQENNQLQAGINSFSFPVTNFAAGVYIVNVKADKFEEAHKVKIK